MWGWWLWLKRAGVVLTFRTVYSARLHENAGLLVMYCDASNLYPEFIAMNDCFCSLCYAVDN